MKVFKGFSLILLFIFSFTSFAQEEFDPLNDKSSTGIRANELETEDSFFEEDGEEEEEAAEPLPDEVSEDFGPLLEETPDESEITAEEEERATDEIVEQALDDSPEELDKEPIPQIKRKRVELKSQYRREKRYIEHPFAKKGLIRITKDKTYIYKTPTTRQTGAASFKVGLYDPVNLNNGTNDFSTIYEDSDATPMVLFDYEWQMFKGFGILNIKVGTGFYLTTGNARFADNSEAREAVTFLVFPNSAGLVYRMQYFDKQLIIPYVEGGGDVFTFAERRDDDNNPSLGAALGASYLAHFSLGGQLNLGALSKTATLNLDREYGINNMHVSFEYRSYVHLGSDFDFSADMFNLGVVTEF